MPVWARESVKSKGQRTFHARLAVGIVATSAAEDGPMAEGVDSGSISFCGEDARTTGICNLGND
eukprot:3731194-Ditylum_brightwellii.AAC.1